MKEFLELFNRFYEKFAKLSFYRRTKTRYNKVKLIIKRERFRCVYRDFKDRSRRIYLNLTKKLSFQSIEKENKKEIQRCDEYVNNTRCIRDVDATYKEFAIFKNDQKIKIHND